MSIPRTGFDTLCATCRHGFVVTRKTIRNPVDVYRHERESPGVEFPEPPVVEITDSYCVHPDMVGSPPRAAVEVGCVVRCDRHTRSRP